MQRRLQWQQILVCIKVWSKTFMILSTRLVLGHFWRPRVTERQFSIFTSVLWEPYVILLIIFHTRTVQPVATCRQSPYLHKPAIVIVTSFSLWRHSRVSRLRRSQLPSHYDVILIVTSFATELVTPTVTDVSTLRTGTLPRLIYRDAGGLIGCKRTCMASRFNI